VAASDFNADGRVDLAVANVGGNTISVALGRGDGTFPSGRTFAVGSGPICVVVADFNVDGVRDLAACHFAGTTASVLLGNGNGTFQAARHLGVGAAPMGIGVADFNGDGDPDLAAANHNSHDVSVLLGNGDGTFLTAVHYPAGQGASFVAPRDLNGDNRIDLAVANSSSTTVSVLLGNGDGTFQPARHFPADPGTAPSAIVVEDLNADSRLDLVTVNYGSSNTSVLLGNGDGTFQAARVFAAGPNNWAIAKGDFNRDGRIDLATADFGVSSTSILIGNGDGTFRPPATFPAGLNPHSVAVGDFNGDGAPDLALANSGSTSVSVLMGNGDGTFQPPVNFAAGSRPLSVAVADHNGDGLQDLAVATYYSDAVAILLGSGSRPTVPTPVISPPGGTYTSSVTVSIGVATMGATIHYTLDGSTPTTSSAVYTSPITLTQTATVRAIAVASGMTNSDVASATYTIQGRVATPTFSPAAGTYVSSVTVTITTGTPGATIHYTTDGGTPTTSSTVYTGPITLTQSATIRAMASASGMANSDIASAAYVVQQQQQVATPVISPASGTYVAAVTVQITVSTPGAAIHYTTNGSIPTAASVRYVGPFVLAQSATVRAIAVAAGMTDSAVASSAYTIKAPLPVFTPPGGTYTTPPTVTLSTSVSGAAIYYTTDGSVPTPASTRYTGGIPLTRTTTVRAIVTANGMLQSDVATATYTLQAATPTFNPPGGQYFLGPLLVSLSSSTPGVTIYFTTDGSTPTTASTRYYGSFLVILNTTVKAIAVRDGWSTSPVGSATYTNFLGL
jgi:hypothetical protein